MDEADQEAPPDASRSTLGVRVKSGAFATAFAKVFGQVLRLGANIVLSYLLFPEAFGLMAILVTLSLALEMISDIGITPSIIQHRRGDERDFLDTAWTMQIMRGVLCWLAATALAIPIARFYGEPELSQLIPYMTLSTVVMGFQSTKMAGLQRKVTLGRMALIELIAAASGSAYMMVHAAITRTVWALATGVIVVAIVNCLLTHFAIPGPNNRLRWEKAAVDELLGFGKWIVVSSVATLIALKFDVVALAKLVPLDTLGLYSLAVGLSALPMAVGSPVLGVVLLPALAEVYRSDKARLSSSFERARSLILPFGLFLTLATTLLAPPFFVLAYDARYWDAGWMTQLLALGAWCSYLHEVSSRLLVAVGMPSLMARANVLRLFTIVCGSLVGWVLFEFVGFVLGITFGLFVGYLAVTMFLRTIGLYTARRDLAYTLLGVSLAGLGILTAQRLPGATPVEAAWMSVAIALVIGLPYTAWLAVRARRVLRGGGAS